MIGDLPNILNVGALTMKGATLALLVVTNKRRMVTIVCAADGNCAIPCWAFIHDVHNQIIKDYRIASYD